MQFLELTDEQIHEFRAWARANYTPGTPINALWHPVTRDECERMNTEARTLVLVRLWWQDGFTQQSQLYQFEDLNPSMGDVEERLRTAANRMFRNMTNEEREYALQGNGATWVDAFILFGDEELFDVGLRMIVNTADMVELDGDEYIYPEENE